MWGGVLDWGVRWGKANRDPRVGGKGAAPGHFQLGLLREAFQPHLQPAFPKPPSQAGQSVRAINTKEPTLLYLQHEGCLYKQLANIIKNKRGE